MDIWLGYGLHDPGCYPVFIYIPAALLGSGEKQNRTEDPLHTLLLHELLLRGVLSM